MKLTREEKQILDNLKKSIPKLTTEQKNSLLIGSMFIVAMAENNQKKANA